MENVTQKSKGWLLWYVYSGALIVLSIIQLVRKVTTDTGGFPSRYLPLLGALLLAYAIYQRVNAKPLPFVWGWRIYCVLLGAAMMALLGYGAGLLVGGTHEGGTILVFGMLFLAPAWWQASRAAFSRRV